MQHIPYTSSATAPQLLTSEETAQWLGLKSKHTLEVWRCTKRYPELEYVKVGRLVRYKREAVERFLALNTVSAATQ